MKPARSSNQVGNTKVARILYPDGRIIVYSSDKLAYQVYSSLPRGVKAAFRAAGDKTWVYPADFIS